MPRLAAPLRLLMWTFFLSAGAAALPGGNAHAATLPDSGQTVCYDSSAINSSGVDADTGTHPRQDCRHGADAAATASVNYKIGGGEAGFDYTALDASGNATTPSSGATPHPCVRDNLTGLVWEVKTDDGGLHDKDHTYTWYNSDNATNGGNAGSTGIGSCGGTLTNCNTEAYVAAVNVAGWCGANDWRLPSPRELLSLVHFGRSYPPIDPSYFPNTVSGGHFWTSATYAPYPTSAWNVIFGDGYASADGKASTVLVRLVRSGQF